MPRPRALDLSSHSSSVSKKYSRSPRVVPSPLMKRGAWHARHYLIKFVSRNVMHGKNKSRLLFNNIHRRLCKFSTPPCTPSLMTCIVRRGLNTPHTPRTAFVLPNTSTDLKVTMSPPDSATLPILLPTLPILSLPLLCDTVNNPDSGYCSDASPSPSPTTGAARRRRRYILPDPVATSPADLALTDELRVRLSATVLAGSPRIPPLHFEPLAFAF
ncbi:hypothetical protein GGX14DRAFT_203952 [Mycena pura]|uniref:Uncharacterized protein n=1 Tax=Mycena pura TaxID=153505 RepID=A0AAD6VRV4_9AGAR|nr:hypothetical protein GGX14DRAFT_203952 [Mycena pura]